MGDLEPALRHTVSKYLAGHADAAEVYRWVADRSWEVERREPAPTARLLRDAELYLSEFQHGDWSEDELKSRLRGMFSAIANDLEALGATTTGSQSKTLWFAVAATLGGSRVTLQVQGADTRA
jgi:hypothetical protein